jgi:hypothetical protein
LRLTRVAPVMSAHYKENIANGKQYIICSGNIPPHAT